MKWSIETTFDTISFLELVVAYADEMRKNFPPGIKSLRHYESMADGDGGELLNDIRLEAELSDSEGDPLPVERQSAKMRQEIVHLAVKRAAACILLLECWGITSREMSATKP